MATTIELKLKEGIDWSKGRESYRGSLTGDYSVMFVHCDVCGQTASYAPEEFAAVFADGVLSHQLPACPVCKANPGRGGDATE